jgi:hypothetical protein
MSTSIHIPKDWKRRAVRALRNLNRPGVAAACFGAAINTVLASIVQRPNGTTGCNTRSSRRRAS